MNQVPRYFFDLYNDIDSVDEEGTELPGIVAAQARALREASEMICASVTEHHRVDLRHCIRIRDEAGSIVGTVRFEDAVTFVREGAAV